MISLKGLLAREVRRLKNIPTGPNLFFIVEIEALGREGSHFLVQLVQILQVPTVNKFTQFLDLLSRSCTILVSVSI